MNLWRFPKEVPQNGWSIRENPISIDDFWGYPPIYRNLYILSILILGFSEGPSGPEWLTLLKWFRRVGSAAPYPGKNPPEVLNESEASLRKDLEQVT